MLHYPKMPNNRNAPTKGKCWAFEKYDGTNLHFDWERDFGWHSFGTRRDEFNLTEAGIRDFAHAHAHLDGCADLFTATLADGLEQVFTENPAYQAVSAFKVFTEYLGPGSFAGLHREGEAKQLVLFDVWAADGGFLGPEAFVRDFGHLPFAARVVYKGKLTGQFADDVRTGKYGVAEGVVCKGGPRSACTDGGGTGGENVWMVKIKTDAYREKLKKAFSDNWENYWE